MSLDDGGRLELTSDDLLSQYRFQKKCIDELSYVPPKLKESDWHKYLAEKLSQAEEIPAPDDTSAAGAFRDILEAFLTQRAQAAKIDEVLLGKPWFDEETGIVWFRLADLRAWLNRERFFELSRPQIVARLRDMGAQHKFKHLRKRGTNLWGVPLEVETEPYEVPQVGEEIPF